MNATRCTKAATQTKESTRAGEAKRAGPQRPRTPNDSVLDLHATLGNRAVQRLFASGLIQARLDIGRVNDAFEQEAERVAGQITGEDAPVVDEGEPLPEETGVAEAGETLAGEEEPAQTPPSISPLNRSASLQRRCAACDEPSASSHDGMDTQERRTRLADTQALIERGGLEGGLRDIEGRGERLPDRDRRFFEHRLGRDLAQVRIHRHDDAHRLSRNLNAQAFTLGRHIVFGQGRFAPGTRAGRHLLAHELVHVVQQGAAGRIRRRPRDGFGKARKSIAKSAPWRISRLPLTVRGGKRIMRLTDPYLAACERQFERCIRTSYSSMSCLAGLTSCRLHARPRLYIQSASVPQNRIYFYLIPRRPMPGVRRRAWPFTLELLRGGRVGYTFGTWNLASNRNRYRIGFHLNRLPVGEYDRIRAKWRVYGADYYASYPYRFRVLGLYHHSQYNTPYENTCPGPARRAYITNAPPCTFTRTRLRRGFIAQVNMNGNGVSRRYGRVVRERFCLGRPGAPADAANRSFRQVAVIYGSCNARRGRLNNHTVARRPNHPYLGCNDRVYIHGFGVKTVTDLCPGCGVNQLDNYTTQRACTRIGDLSRNRLLTIKLY